jgi:hypothetical protein
LLIAPHPGLGGGATPPPRRRTGFESHILQVGAQVEAITNSLAYLRHDVLFDAGLPVVVQVPENVRIRPGEMVDITIRSGRRAPVGEVPPSAGLQDASQTPRL